MNKLKPEIRFKGFEKHWVKSKYEETFTHLSNNTLSRANLNYNSGFGKNIHYGDILVKFGELIDVENEILPFIDSEDIVTKYKKSSLNNGDIIIADAAEDETVGKCSEITNIGNEKVISGLHTIPARPIKTFASKYLGYYMNSSAYHNQLLRLMQGTKVLSISKSALKDTSIVYPEIQEEQTQIGNFFQNLDTLIAQHQKKYDKLLILKKAMLEKMFPKPGKAIPEIRFKGFGGDWEKKELGDIGSVAMNKRIFKNQTSENGEIPFFKIGTFGGVPDAFISRKLFEEFKDKYPYPKKGDILISASGSIGRTIEYSGKDEYFQDSNIVWLQHNGKIENSFLKYFYSVVKWSGLEGSTIQRLYNKNILDTLIYVPTLDEQQKIGDYFQNLDKLISNHQTQLVKLKNIKKACLEKMFV
ncbi:restriction endonuclease subunit S [uncultured Draconibacterium sp.]|uniref:restriction endonuclease subunit S n=1 Tax=uncultured Draconibacterium sp. TaxID=1573823 RepID=UPI00262B70AC|nr:restriction endonuclease subunit S [uncultured Draconibacterium sp.]